MSILPLLVERAVRIVVMCVCVLSFEMRFVTLFLRASEFEASRKEFSFCRAEKFKNRPMKFEFFYFQSITLLPFRVWYERT